MAQPVALDVFVVPDAEFVVPEEVFAMVAPDAAAGGVSECLSGHPLDTVKVRLVQAQSESASGVPRGAERGRAVRARPSRGGRARSGSRNGTRQRDATRLTPLSSPPRRSLRGAPRAACSPTRRPSSTAAACGGRATRARRGRASRRSTTTRPSPAHTQHCSRLTRRMSFSCTSAAARRRSR